MSICWLIIVAVTVSESESLFPTAVNVSELKNEKSCHRPMSVKGQSMHWSSLNLGTLKSNAAALKLLLPLGETRRGPDHYVIFTTIW